MQTTPRKLATRAPLLALTLACWGVFACSVSASTTSVNFTEGSWLREDDASTAYNLEASTRLIYNHSSPGYDASILMKAVLPASMGTITGVKVRAYRTGVESAQLPVSLFSTQSFSAPVTWNGKPSEVDQLGSTITTGTDSTWYEFDAGETYTWGDSVYVVLREANQNTGLEGVYFAMFANADQTLRPHVEIEYTAGATPTVSPTPTPTDISSASTVSSTVYTAEENAVAFNMWLYGLAVIAFGSWLGFKLGNRV